MNDVIEKAKAAAAIAEDFKANRIKIMDLRGICDFTDLFIVCSGSSNVQIRAIAKGINDGMKESKLGSATVDGMDNAVWVVLDYGDMVIHVMSEESRDYYRLESLWGDAKEIEFESKRQAEVSQET